jgi:hypothetical protein
MEKPSELRRSSSDGSDEEMDTSDLHGESKESKSKRDTVVHHSSFVQHLITTFDKALESDGFENSERQRKRMKLLTNKSNAKSKSVLDFRFALGADCSLYTRTDVVPLQTSGMDEEDTLVFPKGLYPSVERAGRDGMLHALQMEIQQRKRISLFGMLDLKKKIDMWLSIPEIEEFVLLGESGEDSGNFEVAALSKRVKKLHEIASDEAVQTVGQTLNKELGKMTTLVKDVQGLINTVQEPKGRKVIQDGILGILNAAPAPAFARGRSRRNRMGEGLLANCTPSNSLSQTIVEAQNQADKYQTADIGGPFKTLAMAMLALQGSSVPLQRRPQRDENSNHTLEQLKVFNFYRATKINDTSTQDRVDRRALSYTLTWYYVSVVSGDMHMYKLQRVNSHSPENQAVENEIMSVVTNLRPAGVLRGPVWEFADLIVWDDISKDLQASIGVVYYSNVVKLKKEFPNTSEIDKSVFSQVGPELTKWQQTRSIILAITQVSKRVNDMNPYRNEIRISELYTRVTMSIESDILNNNPSGSDAFLHVLGCCKPFEMLQGLQSIVQNVTEETSLNTTMNSVKLSIRNSTGKFETSMTQVDFHHVWMEGLVYMFSFARGDGETDDMRNAVSAWLTSVIYACVNPGVYLIGTFIHALEILPDDEMKPIERFQPSELDRIWDSIRGMWPLVPERKFIPKSLRILIIKNLFMIAKKEFENLSPTIKNEKRAIATAVQANREDLRFQSGCMAFVRDLERLYSNSSKAVETFLQQSGLEEAVKTDNERNNAISITLGELFDRGEDEDRFHPDVDDLLTSMNERKGVRKVSGNTVPTTPWTDKAIVKGGLKMWLTKNKRYIELIDGERTYDKKDNLSPFEEIIEELQTKLFNGNENIQKMALLCMLYIDWDSYPLRLKQVPGDLGADMLGLEKTERAVVGDPKRPTITVRSNVALGFEISDYDDERQFALAFNFALKNLNPQQIELMKEMKRYFDETYESVYDNNAPQMAMFMRETLIKSLDVAVGHVTAEVASYRRRPITDKGSLGTALKETISRLIQSRDRRFFDAVQEKLGANMKTISVEGPLSEEVKPAFKTFVLQKTLVQWTEWGLFQYSPLGSTGRNINVEDLHDMLLAKSPSLLTQMNAKLAEHFENEKRFHEIVKKAALSACDGADIQCKSPDDALKKIWKRSMCEGSFRLLQTSTYKKRVEHAERLHKLIFVDDTDKCQPNEIWKQVAPLENSEDMSYEAFMRKVGPEAHKVFFALISEPLGEELKKAAAENAQEKLNVMRWFGALGLFGRTRLQLQAMISVVRGDYEGLVDASLKQVYDDFMRIVTTAAAVLHKTLGEVVQKIAPEGLSLLIADDEPMFQSLLGFQRRELFWGDLSAINAYGATTLAVTYLLEDTGRNEFTDEGSVTWWIRQSWFGRHLMKATTGIDSTIGSVDTTDTKATEPSDLSKKQLGMFISRTLSLNPNEGYEIDFMKNVSCYGQGFFTGIGLVGVMLYIIACFTTSQVEEAVDANMEELDTTDKKKTFATNVINALRMNLIRLMSYMSPHKGLISKIVTPMQRLLGWETPPPPVPLNDEDKALLAAAVQLGNMVLSETDSGRLTISPIFENSIDCNSWSAGESGVEWTPKSPSGYVREDLPVQYCVARGLCGQLGPYQLFASSDPAQGVARATRMVSSARQNLLNYFVPVGDGGFGNTIDRETSTSFEIASLDEELQNVCWVSDRNYNKDRTRSVETALTVKWAPISESTSGGVRHLKINYNDYTRSLCNVVVKEHFVDHMEARILKLQSTSALFKSMRSDLLKWKATGKVLQMEDMWHIANAHATKKAPAEFSLARDTVLMTNPVSFSEEGMHFPCDSGICEVKNAFESEGILIRRGEEFFTTTSPEDAGAVSETLTRNLKITGGNGRSVSPRLHVSAPIDAYTEESAEIKVRNDWNTFGEDVENRTFFSLESLRQLLKETDDKIKEYNNLECEETALKKARVELKQRDDDCPDDGGGGDDPTSARRNALWNDALREAALAGDRFYSFLVQLSGSIAESIETVATVDDGQMQAQQRRVQEQRVASAAMAARVHLGIVQSVFTEVFKQGSFSLGISTSGPSEFSVESSALREQALKLATGGGSGGFFANGVELSRLLSSGTGSMPLSELIERLQGVGVALQRAALHAQPTEQLNSHSLTFLSAPRNSLLIRWKAEAKAAVRRTFDLLKGEVKARSGGGCGGCGRLPTAYELIEGPNDELCNAFAHTTAYVLSHSRLTAPAYAPYLNVNSRNAIGQQLRISLALLVRKWLEHARRYSPPFSYDSRSEYFTACH